MVAQTMKITSRVIFLSLPQLAMKLIPEKEKQMLQSMSDACIGPAVGRNCIFSKLGKFIARSQLAYFTSKPSLPLADGLENWIHIVCQTFLKGQKRYPIIHCGTYHKVAENHLSFPVSMLIGKKALRKSITPMILISLNHLPVPRRRDRTHWFMNLPELFLLSLGPTSMTFTPSCYILK